MASLLPLLTASETRRRAKLVTLVAPSIATAIHAMIGAAPSPTRVTPVMTGLQSFSAASGMTAGHGFVALAVGERDRPAALYVGVPGKLTPARGVGTLPADARPHIGSGADGAAVVVYPRCAGDDLRRRCDLYQYDLAKETESKVAGVNTAGGSEVEGAMERGALAFTRYAKGRTAEYTLPTTLHYKPVGPSAERLVTKSGGEQITLHGESIAQLHDVNPFVDFCGTPAIELLSLTGDAKVLRTTGCGMEESGLTSPSFAAGALHFGAWSVNSTTGDRLYRYDLRTHVLTEAPTKAWPIGFVMTNGDAGVLMESDFSDGTSAKLFGLTDVRWRAIKR